MPINLKSPEAERLIRRLAHVTGESITDAVLEAVRQRLKREESARRSDVDRSWARIEQLQRRVREQPLLDPRSSDEIIGYNESGVPT
jgi:antitoxin VapB